MHKDTAKKLFAGLFFVLSIALLVGVIFVIGVEKGLTEPKFELSVLFNKVGGLTIGAPVRLSGVTVGSVSDIDFVDHEVNGRGVKVVLSLFSKYRAQVHKSIKFAIITEGVLGEKIIEITTDPDFYLDDLSHPFIGQDPLDVQNLAETFGESAEALLETSKEISGLTKELGEISLSVRRLLNRIEQRLIEGNLFKIF